MSNLGLKFHRLVSLPAMAVALGVVFTLGAPDAMAAEKQIVFGASVPLLNDPAWVRIIDYGQYVAKQLGVKLDVVDAQGKEDKQIADVQSLLSRGVDLLDIRARLRRQRARHHSPGEPGQSARHRGRPLPGI